MRPVFPAAVALVLILPAVARALLGVPNEPQAGGAPGLCRRTEPIVPSGGERPVLVRKVDKATVRAAATAEARPVEERTELSWSPPLGSTPVVRVTIAALTKPASLRIFLISTPHNHRAPPAA